MKNISIALTDFVKSLPNEIMLSKGELAEYVKKYSELMDRIDKLNPATKLDMSEKFNSLSLQFDNWFRRHGYGERRAFAVPKKKKKGGSATIKPEKKVLTTNENPKETDSQKGLIDTTTVICIPLDRLIFANGSFVASKFVVSDKRSQKSFNHLKNYLTKFKKTELIVLVDSKTRKVLQADVTPPFRRLV
ncbi:MAG: hypothetical protein EAZ91_23195 [Cytophagales bacterium]|nr:MAG: hypothetical protein EAZ91_23195 [Cytophagales bacterium]